MQRRLILRIRSNFAHVIQGIYIHIFHPFILPPTLPHLSQTTRGVKRVTEAEYKAALDGLAESAFDDQCTGANPRYPLISDLRTILEEAYDAPITPVKTLEFFSKV